jgi:toxin HigB-1
VIVSFGDAETEKVFLAGKSRRFGAIAKVAERRLADIERARDLQELRFPAGNRLERLKGDRSGQWSIRVNDQFRICFKWGENGAEGVEIVDYH